MLLVDVSINRLKTTYILEQYYQDRAKEPNKVKKISFESKYNVKTI